MSGPPRLIDEGATDTELELLRSWRTEAPSRGARNIALGLMAGTATSTVAATATATAGTKAVGTAAAWGIGKWILLSTLVGATAIGVISYRGSSTPSGVAAPAASIVEQGASVAAVPDPTATTSAATSVELPAIPEDTADVSAHPRVSRPSAIPSDTAPSASLLDEVASIQRARDALAGNPAEALRAIDAHDAAFPRGALSQEARFLRIEALVNLGRRAQARSLARAFLASHPTNVYAARLQKLFPELTSP